MNIYSDGQSRVLNGAFPKRFKLLNGEQEVPYLRTGDNSIRITGEIPVGDLIIQEIIREKMSKPQESPIVPQIVMLDKKEVDKLEKASVDLEESKQALEQRTDELERVAVALVDKEDKNAEAIVAMDEAVSGIVENLQKEITGAVKQTNDAKKQLGKMISESTEDLKDSIVAHENANNPHRITKVTVGLDKVENIAPEDMPVSKATKKALEKKADKEDLQDLKEKLNESGKSQERIQKGIERMSLMGGVGGNELPSGGKKGQVLAKKSNNTGDYEWVSNAEGSVTDVTVNGTSVVTDGVAVIPLAAQNGDYGLIKLRSAAYGLGVDSSGCTIINRASTTDIDEKTAYYKPITPINLDYATKRGLAYNDLTLSDTEKASACSLVGALPNNIYGESTTAASTVQKKVSIPSITSLNAGQLIIVTPTATSTVANSTLKLNDFDAYPMLYGGNAITTSTDSYVWIKDVPGWWLFDGSNWLFAGHGYDINTTYNSTTLAIMIAGENTTNRLIAPSVLKDGTFGVVTAYSSGDTITPDDKYLYTSTADISALTIVAPSSPDVRYMAQINMSSGSTATTLTYPSTFKVLEGCDDVQYIAGVRTFVPVANKRYQIFIENDGVNNVMFAKGV